MTPVDVACFKYALVTSVDLERAFSLYRNVIADKRRHLTYDNLSEIILSRVVCVHHGSACVDPR